MSAPAWLAGGRGRTRQGCAGCRPTYHSDMFGGRTRRVGKLAEGAVKNLESGEEIRELVQTQTGQAAWDNAGAVMRSGVMSEEFGTPYVAKTKAGPHILVATDRNLYAMTLSGARLLNVGDVVLKAPLDQAELRQGKKTLVFDGETFHVMAGFGEHADRLYSYVVQVGAERGR
jgi:hypothetical protein